ncbi:MAG TPA: FAD-binding protein [Syntrophorhabdaceae bacterium]|nr:FAD-binding protein [Syntrophorhabdaceae bacterium]
MQAKPGRKKQSAKEIRGIKCQEDEIPMHDPEDADRRAFLKGMLAGAGALTVAGLGVANAKPVNVMSVARWDVSADVVVIGFGPTGASAAIAAHDASAKVVILEKMAVPGGNSGVCFGGIVIPNGVSEAVNHYRKLSGGTVDEDMVEGFARAMVGVEDLLSRLGARLRTVRSRSMYEALRDAKLTVSRFNPTGKEGFAFLRGHVQKRGINVMLKTAARNLVQVPETGEIVGVKAENQGKEIYIKAERGVILSCGGYESNPEMFGYYNYPGLNDFVFPLGTPGNTGDGLKMAAGAGAYLWHTASLQWYGFCARAPSKLFGTAIYSGIPAKQQGGSFIFVNKYGKRFMKETKRYYHFKGPLEVLYLDHDRAEYPHVPAYLVFDEAYRTGGPLERSAGPVGYNAVHGVYDWSTDNSAEIEKGWIVRGDKVGDLSEKIKINRTELEKTVAEFNQYSAAGKDLSFGRDKDSMAPILTPPYYALEMGLAIVNTQGGPRRNKFAQVLDPDNRPIPRLYAAGELGSFFGFLYEPGSNYPEAIAFGAIAGNQAAAEKPFKE